jgi:hypothetical protein
MSRLGNSAMPDCFCLVRRRSARRSLLADTRPSVSAVTEVLISISGIPGRSRKGNRVAHIGEARDLSDGALEAEAKTRVWHRTVTA